MCFRRVSIGKAVESSAVDENDWLRIANAQLRYYLHLNPDDLSDAEWAMRYAELEYLRKKERNTFL